MKQLTPQFHKYGKIHAFLFQSFEERLKLQCVWGSLGVKQERLKRWKGSGKVGINGETNGYSRGGRGESVRQSQRV